MRDEALCCDEGVKMGCSVGGWAGGKVRIMERWVENGEERRGDEVIVGLGEEGFGGKTRLEEGREGE